MTMEEMRQNAIQEFMFNFKMTREQAEAHMVILDKFYAEALKKACKEGYKQGVKDQWEAHQMDLAELRAIQEEDGKS